MANLAFITNFFTTILILAIAVNCENSAEDVIKWSHTLSLDRGLTVRWTRDDPEWLVMEMCGPTNGYVSLGFSPHGGMGGSDIVIGWVDGNGKGYIQDYYATGNQRPVLDPVQNYELLRAEEKENRTTIRFRRKWNTCDKDHDFVIGDDTARIIWAYNENDPELVPVANSTQMQYKPAYHGEIRGVRRSYIRIPPHHAVFPDPQKNEHLKHWDVLMKNNTVSAENDVYFCTIVKFPALEKKHHMIGFQPILVEENKWNIHHMIMYECIVPESDGGSKKIFEEHVSGPGGRCYTPNMPPTWSRYCINIPILWTSGSEGNVFPENVGFPLGEEYGGTTYFMFEIHYDNPQFKTFTDSSGMRIVYTDELREHDGSVFAVGHKISAFETVPHSMPSFTAKAFCTSECTNQVIPPKGITAITVLLHAHLAGRKIELKHLRNGVELPPLAKDDKYDYNYQQARALQPGRQILPGDELITICEYDTTQRTTPAFGGLGTRDEMCMSFVYYYPRIPLAECKTQPEFFSFFNALGIHKVDGEILSIMNMPYVPKDGQEKEYPDGSFTLKNSTYDNPLIAFDALNIVEADDSTAVGRTVGEFIKSYNWVEKGKEIEKKWLDGKQYAFCTGPNQKRYPLKDYIVSHPNFQKVAEPVDKCIAPSA